jgi:hypothetical protein
MKAIKKERGKGYWKMNVNLLDDKEYISQAKNVIQETNCRYKSCCKQTIWEMIKVNIKEMSIRYSVEKSKCINKNKKHLQARIDEIYILMNNGCKNNELVKEKECIESKLDELYCNEVKGAQIRAKVQWVEEGERSSKYFLSLKKTHQATNTITQLKSENSDVITDDLDILNECANFYEKLYCSRNIDQSNVEEYIMHTNVPKLDESCKLLCESDIKESDVYEAVKNLKYNKSPGLDGIIPEFYKVLWKDIKKPYMDMLAETLQKGEMAPSMRQSVLSLIYKKGDKDNIKNYRPISLSNYDYKIFAFVLAKRLQSVIGSIIHEDQCGYIKGRFIGQNTRLINDIYEYCEVNEIPGAIIMLDFEKAFDMLEWNFMFETLKQFNFGSNFINYIKILYANPSIIVKNNGWLSESIKMQRGIRQGCPISAMLFILSVEIMSYASEKTQKSMGSVLTV